MGAESTTMSAMDTNEPQSVAATVADLTARFPHLKRASELDAKLQPDDFAQDETAAEKAERLSVRQEHYRARWDRVMPPLFANASVDELDERQHAVRARAWLQSGSLHLVLAGAVGTGKTHAAYAIGNQALDAGLWVEAWNVGDLLDKLRPGSDDRAADQRARDCRVLILDDLTAKATDWEAERMTLLLDARTRAMRQTIVTTNITADQIAAVWGSRFMDRLRYRMTALTFVGESRRTEGW